MNALRTLVKEVIKGTTKKKSNKRKLYLKNLTFCNLENKGRFHTS